METYSYEASTKEGSIVTGTIDAADEHIAVSRLQEKGYFPLKVGKAEEHKLFFSNLLSFMHSRVRERDVMTFTYQLGVLLDAGFPLERALFILSDLTEKKTLREIIQEILSNVRGGKSFSESLSKFPSVFPLLYVNMIKASESGGFLEDTISRLAVYLENSQTLKDDIRSALIYPFMLSIVGGAAVIALLTFVVPQFTMIFADMGEALPLSTVILLG
ncbi:MAG: type II secretion system F family protein, partial [Candidatus Mariimomonas ferrooxydans]